MLNEIRTDTERKMQKTVTSITEELAGIRSGKATPALLDSVKVDAYGQKMPLNQVASVSVPDPKSLVVQPWDKTLIGDIVKAIQVAELGFNPQVEGPIIRVPVPPLSEERRVELVKHCKKIAEEGKVAVRNIRREANERLKKAEKDKKVSQDEQRDGTDKIQHLTDKFIRDIDDLVARKEKEIMQV
ncbi:MAG: ribosome recycling factor [candidate division Zixibacteria bacterium]|nr:ribosome recycling factor [candidate division Zixibacteria bacterium]